MRRAGHISDSASPPAAREPTAAAKAAATGAPSQLEKIQKGQDFLFFEGLSIY